MESARSAQAVDSEEPPVTKRAGPEPRGSFWQQLLHRWFVEYNPLYLVSALLVLGGLTLISRSTAESSSTDLQIAAVASIAEVYAFALIAGAALLMRIGLRRPAVMLSLMTALYQGDLTLLTERQVYLGFAGTLAVTLWLVMFVAKIYALAWAMRLRLSRSAVAVSAFGALGMVIMPHLLQHGEASDKSMLVAVFVFALFASGLWTSREVTSTETLDAWGQTVFARAQRATWMLWATLVSLHVLFWCTQFGASPALLAPVAMLLATRGMRNETKVWVATLAALLHTTIVDPQSLWLVSLFAAATLGLRALRRPTLIEHAADAASDVTPYRASGTEAPPPRFYQGFARSERDAMLRLLGGSIFGVYLSMWTIGWSGGALPQHVILLDAALLIIAALMAYRAHTKVMIPPAALTWFHAGVAAGILTLPTSGLQWGMTAVGSGFVMLLGSLAIAWRLRATREPVADSPAR